MRILQYVKTQKCANYIKQSLFSCFTQPVILSGSQNPCLSQLCHWTCEPLPCTSWSMSGHHIRLCARVFILGFPPRSSTSRCSRPGGRSHYIPLLHNPLIMSWQLQTSHPTCLHFLIQTIRPTFKMHLVTLATNSPNTICQSINFGSKCTSNWVDSSKALLTISTAYILLAGTWGNMSNRTLAWTDW